MFWRDDQPVLSWGAHFLVTAEDLRDVKNETETRIIRAAKKLFNAMDFPVSGYIFDGGQTSPSMTNAVCCMSKRG
jgi:hypothetical protein